MSLVQLTEKPGANATRPIWLNPEAVDTVAETSSAGTCVNLRSGRTIFLAETAREIVQALYPAQLQDM